MNIFTQDHHGIEKPFVKRARELPPGVPGPQLARAPTPEEAAATPKADWTYALSAGEEYGNAAETYIRNAYSTDYANRWNTKINKMGTWDRIKMMLKGFLGKILDVFQIKHKFYDRLNTMQQETGFELLQAQGVVPTDINPEKKTEIMNNMFPVEEGKRMNMQDVMTSQLDNKASPLSKRMEPFRASTRDTITQSVPNIVKNQHGGSYRDWHNTWTEDPDAYMKKFFTPDAAVPDQQYSYWATAAGREKPGVISQDTSHAYNQGQRVELEGKFVGRPGDRLDAYRYVQPQPYEATKQYDQLESRPWATIGKGSIKLKDELKQFFSSGDTQ